MKDRLFFRFFVIIIVAVASTLTAIYRTPKLGIDLAGGTSLVYELDLDKLPAVTGENRMEMAQKVVEVLKKRVDPYGQKSIMWRVLEQGKRIQIQMPFPPQETRNAKEVEKEAFAVVEKVAWKDFALREALKETGPAREEALARFAPRGSDEYKLLQDLAQAWDAFSKAASDLEKYQPGGTQTEEQLLTARREADRKFESLLGSAMEKSVNPDALKRTVATADDSQNSDDIESRDKYPERFPLQKKEIEAYLKAHKDLIKLSGGGITDVNELKRLVTRAGVLDFRIAVFPQEIGNDQYTEAVRVLRQKGPEQQIDVGGTKARWFLIDRNGRDSLLGGGYVTASLPEDPEAFILLYDDHDRTLTHSDPKRQSWRAGAKDPQSNGGEIQLPFFLDPIGAGYMGQLTTDWMKHPMAILLDDKAMSAPTINGRITDSGVITFGKKNPTAVLKEAQQLKAIMDAGSLPATLRSEPISEENISSDMGADNIAAGLRSSFIAVIAVMGFMCLYYTITGLFADLALMLNLALVMATMAMFQATYTLPGIAGLVLTLGMAVDANVLINERIREEAHRGASLWMAIKQGYDKVFWTIFDANLTTSLTSIVLIFVGSEEVKGFGVTLLIGLFIHMFTALFVTRTMMTAAVKWGVIKAIDDHSLSEYIREIVTFSWIRNGHWPFMRVITVSNIDWIGKRKIFWGVSAIITVGGIIAFVARGDDKYDIEFRGGTQVTIQLIDPYGPLRDSVYALAQDPAAVKDHPALTTINAPSKDSAAKKNQKLETLAEELAKDANLVKAHPEAAKYPEMIAAAREKTLTIDEVRSRVQGIAPHHPALVELEQARIYAVGSEDARRYQLQTTIANRPQDFDKTLRDPLAERLKGIADPASIQIKVESDATRVKFTILPRGGSAIPEIRKQIAELGTQQQFSDLQHADVKPTGDPALRQIEVTIPNQGVKKILLEPLAGAFDGFIETKPRLSMRNDSIESAKELEEAGFLQPITSSHRNLEDVFRNTQFTDLPRRNIEKYRGGAAFILDELKTAAGAPINAGKLTERITSMRRSSQFSGEHSRDFTIFPITVRDGDKIVPATEDDTRPLVRAVLVTIDPAYPFDENTDARMTAWRTKVAASEWNIIRATLSDSSLFDGVTSFDAVVASQAKFQALIAIVVSLALIVIYVWVRFGGINYGLGAILSLGHDATVALAATVLAKYVANNWLGEHLLLTDFKINLTMIAAYLTIIGYSVNDTIVIFDRVRELRGKSHIPLTKQLVNDAINQCFGRTIWTTFTVFVVLIIMYVWGGEGVRGFAFAMLIGVITGAYSTLAIASPMLLFTGAGGGPTLKGPNPFQRKEIVEAQP